MNIRSYEVGKITKHPISIHSLSLIFQGRLKTRGFVGFVYVYTRILRVEKRVTLLLLGNGAEYIFSRNFSKQCSILHFSGAIVMHVI